MNRRKFIPSDFDVSLGKTIAMTRNRFGWSQKDLARRLGVSFQQVQKYETGGNRLSVSRLQMIAECFEMTVSELMDGSTQEYIHDEDIRKTIDLMYKMTPDEQRFILQAASYVLGAVVPGPVRKFRTRCKIEE